MRDLALKDCCHCRFVTSMKGMTHTITKPSSRHESSNILWFMKGFTVNLFGIIVPLPQEMLTMANTLDLTLYRASSSHVSNIRSDDVATLSAVQEAVQRKVDDPGSIRYFICQLLNAEESSPKSVLQRLDHSFQKNPQSTGLGTLNRLPLEVRRQIWHEVLKAEFFNAQYLGSEPIRYMGGRHYAIRRKSPHSEAYTIFEIFSISVFRSESYPTNRVPFDKCYTEGEYAGFKEHLPRLISHSVKGELEDLHLRNHIFAFECHDSLDIFLDQLSGHQALQLRRISLLVFTCDDCYVEPNWRKVIERLPRMINVVLITLDALHAYQYLKCSPLQRHLNPSKKFIRRVLSAADVLRNQILRQLPHARLFLEGSLFDQLNASDRAALETLSADKMWSNVDRKTLL